MIRYFENPFDDYRITDGRLLNFVDDHIARVRVRNDGGLHDDYLAALAAARTTLRGDQQTEDVARVRRIGKTRSVDQLVELFRDDVRQHEGTVKGLFGKESETYARFFPAGLSEYTAIDRPDVPVLVKRWGTLTADLAGQLPPAVVTLFGSYATRYATLRDAQQSEQGKVTEANAKALDSRATMEAVLLDGIHHIGRTHPDQPEQCVAYYQQHLLFPVSRGGKPHLPE